MDDDQNPLETDLPVVVRRGDRVSMKASDFDDLIVRLLAAESHKQRSWWKPW